MTLDGKVALVTGSSTGIGQAIAIRLGAAGAQVIVNYRSSVEEANATVQEINTAAGSDNRAFAIQADVSQVENVQRLVQGTIDHRSYALTKKERSGQAKVASVAWVRINSRITGINNCLEIS